MKSKSWRRLNQGVQTSMNSSIELAVWEAIHATQRQYGGCSHLVIAVQTPIVSWGYVALHAIGNSFTWSGLTQKYFLVWLPDDLMPFPRKSVSATLEIWVSDARPWTNLALSFGQWKQSFHPESLAFQDQQNPTVFVENRNICVALGVVAWQYP